MRVQMRHGWLGVGLSLGVVMAVLAAGCGRDEEPPPNRPAPIVVAPPPPPAPPLPPSGPQPLQPARNPIMSTAVPEGFTRDETTEEKADAPWVHVRGQAKLDDVIEFYTRYLDPGTPSVPRGAGAQPVCRAWAVGPVPGCTGERCVGRTCLDREGGLTIFPRQQPKPPGSPGAVVNVSITTVGGLVRVTIENESLMQILRENLAEERDELLDQDMTKYRTMEEIPAEFID